jgi:hypothetical protein
VQLSHALSSFPHHHHATPAAALALRHGGQARAALPVHAERGGAAGQVWQLRGVPEGAGRGLVAAAAPGSEHAALLGRAAILVPPGGGGGTGLPLGLPKLRLVRPTFRLQHGFRSPDLSHPCALPARPQVLGVCAPDVAFTSALRQPWLELCQLEDRCARLWYPNSDARGYFARFAGRPAGCRGSGMLRRRAGHGQPPTCDPTCDPAGHTCARAQRPMTR